MKALPRFSDLRERKIATSWAQLARLIKNCNFPRGRMLGPNSRTWIEDEI
jgi:predicted DNA-binding transcriptional regulator AlpA